MKLSLLERNEALLDAIESMPVSLAPKRVQQAAALAEKARLAFNSAEAIAILAPGKIATAERAWDIVSESSVRAGGELPPRTLIERAVIGKRIADADLATVARLLASATQKIGTTIADDGCRAEWQKSSEKRATELRTKLANQVAELRRDWFELSQLNSAITYLDNFGTQLYPAPGLRGDPFTILTDAIRATPSQTSTTASIEGEDTHE